ncbi:MAG: hypothetical protein J5758_04795, partial [Abditibacteriota bacterium]|nr:hypothetical protein [Abditibacteriota bacterium]
MKKSGKFWAAIICALALVSFAAYYIQYKTVKPILRGYIEPPVNRVFDPIAASEQKKHYAAYFPDRTFAYAYYYGIDKKKTRYGGTGVAPCYLTTGEYVVFKGKAWPVSGRSGEAVIQG